MGSYMLLILVVVYTILGLVLYHKLFDVIYFGGILNGFAKELFMSFLFGFILAILTLWNWKIVLAIVVVLGVLAIIAAESNAKRIGYLVLLIVGCVVITKSGKEFVKDMKQQTSQNKEDNEEDDYADADTAVTEKTENGGSVDVSDGKMTGLWVFDSSECEELNDADYGPIYFDIQNNKGNLYSIEICGDSEGEYFQNEKAGELDGNVLRVDSSNVFYMRSDDVLIWYDEDEDLEIPMQRPSEEQKSRQIEIKEALEKEDSESEQESEYILPDSDSRYIKKKELKGLSQEECRIARNEIYARHGRKFSDVSLQAYFDAQDWYEGTIGPQNFSESVLNKFEKKNVHTILDYEQKVEK